jgi:hypothetical protein
VTLKTGLTKIHSIHAAMLMHICEQKFSTG